MVGDELPAGFRAITAGAGALLHGIVAGELLALDGALVAQLRTGFGDDLCARTEAARRTSRAEALARDTKFQALGVFLVAGGQALQAVTHMGCTFDQTGGTGRGAMMNGMFCMRGVIGGASAERRDADGSGTEREHHVAAVEGNVDGGGFHGGVRVRRWLFVQFAFV